VVAAGFGANSFCHQDLAALASPIASSTVLLTSRKLVLASLYKEQSSVIPLTQALAANKRDIGSTSLQPQQLLHDVSSNARPKQDGGDDDVELDFDLLHPTLSRLQLLFDRFISLVADSLVDGEVFFDFAHPVTSSAGSGVLPSAHHFKKFW